MIQQGRGDFIQGKSQELFISFNTKDRRMGAGLFQAAQKPLKPVSIKRRGAEIEGLVREFPGVNKPFSRAYGIET
jgi:hypothetical protein